MFWVISAVVLTFIIVILAFYIRFLISRINIIFDNKQDLINKIEEFNSHIGALHQNRLFYGDPMFLNLVKHGNELVKYLKEYQKFYELLEEDETDDIYDEEIEDIETYAYGEKERVQRVFHTRN